MKNLYRFLAYSLLLTANVLISFASNAQSSCSSNSDCGSCQTCSNIKVTATPGSNYSSYMCNYFSPNGVIPSWLTSSCTVAGTCASISGCGNSSSPAVPSTSAPSTSAPSRPAPFTCTLDYMVNNPNTFSNTPQCVDLKTLVTTTAPECFNAVSESIVSALQDGIQAYISSVPQEKYSVLDVAYAMVKASMVQTGITPITQNQFLQALVAYDSEASSNDTALVSAFCAGYYQQAHPLSASTGMNRTVVLRQTPGTRGINMLPHVSDRPRVALFRNSVPVWSKPVKTVQSLF